MPPGHTPPPHGHVEGLGVPLSLQAWQKAPALPAREGPQRQRRCGSAALSAHATHGFTLRSPSCCPQQGGSVEAFFCPR